jgi:hypothetical protein
LRLGRKAARSGAIRCATISAYEEAAWIPWTSMAAESKPMPWLSRLTPLHIASPRPDDGGSFGFPYKHLCGEALIFTALNF